MSTDTKQYEVVLRCKILKSFTMNAKDKKSAKSMAIDLIRNGKWTEEILGLGTIVAYERRGDAG